METAEKQVIFSKSGAKPIGPYSPAIKIGGFLFTSGQIGLDPKTGKLVPGGVVAEAKQALENLKSLLQAGGTNLERVVKTSIFLREIADFPGVNEIYAQYFKNQPPARSTVQAAALPADAQIEIEAIAAL